MSDDRPRQWLTLEAVTAELNVEAAEVTAMIRSGKLQTKRDSFGSTLVSAVSIEAAAGRTFLRGVR